MPSFFELMTPHLEFTHLAGCMEHFVGKVLLSALITFIQQRINNKSPYIHQYPPLHLEVIGQTKVTSSSQLWILKNHKACLKRSWARLSFRCWEPTSFNSSGRGSTVRDINGEFASRHFVPSLQLAANEVVWRLQLGAGEAAASKQLV